MVKIEDFQITQPNQLQSGYRRVGEAVRERFDSQLFIERAQNSSGKGKGPHPKQTTFFLSEEVSPGEKKKMGSIKKSEVRRVESKSCAPLFWADQTA